MNQKHRPLIVGNWKMNPATVSAAKTLFADTGKALGRKKYDVDIVAAPPFPFISDMQRLPAHKQIKLAAQDVFSEPAGSYTGEVSLSMLKSVGVTYTINGHSERRKLGETDEDVYKDVQASIKSGVVTLVCVGEKKRDSNGNYFNIVEQQIHSAVRDIPKSKLKRLVIAYEPVWAIGTGMIPTAEDILEMKLFIQKVLSDHFGRPASNTVRILYGGSVNKKNAEEILSQGGVDGFLIGGASLRGKEFADIVKIASNV